MLRPLPTHGTQRLPNDDDDEGISALQVLKLKLEYFTLNNQYSILSSGVTV